VIHDKGVTEEFRAESVFPTSCPTAKVDDWVNANSSSYDFNKHGWPAWYPTRTLAEWEKARAQWIPYLFREPSDVVRRPSTVLPKKK
jgi:N-sulfoglucosamine sulfohydrolase